MDRTVTFLGTRASCGCTVATLTQTTLVPGESTTLDMSVDLNGRSGPHEFHCSLLVKDGGPWDYGLKTFVCQVHEVRPFLARLEDAGDSDVAHARAFLYLRGAERGTVPSVREIAAPKGLSILQGPVEILEEHEGVFLAKHQFDIRATPELE